MTIFKKQSEMDALFTLLNKSPVPYDEDGELNTSYNNAMFWWEINEITLSPLPQSVCLSAADILYNRFYWFTRFIARSQTLYGIDAGLEQQQFQIIEAMDHESSIDMEECCHIREAIELEVGYRSGYRS